MALLRLCTTQPIRIFLWFACWTSLLPVGLSGQEAPSLEYQIKATFLYNFAKFVEWPEESLARKQTFSICVLGEDPFGEFLNKTVKGETLDQRQLVVHRLTRGANLKDCQILFIARSEREHFREILAALEASSNVLTVGDTERFLEAGGIINFKLVEGKVRFEVNLKAAERTQIKMSSKILRLAIVKVGETEP